MNTAPYTCPLSRRFSDSASLNKSQGRLFQRIACARSNFSLFAEFLRLYAVSRLFFSCLSLVYGTIFFFSSAGN